MAPATLVSNKRSVWLGLGSNLDDPRARLIEASERLARLPQSQLLGRSAWFGSKAWGVEDQPDFVNGCLLIETRLTPLDLLLQCQTIERAMGRQSTRRWGERRIDIDLLCHQGPALTSPELVLPHPWLEQRAFVLAPLADLSPQLVLASANSVQDALDQLLAGYAEPPVWRLD